MAATVEVGTILIEELPPRMAEALALESERYLGNWSVIKALDGLPSKRRSMPPAGTSFSWQKK